MKLTLCGKYLEVIVLRCALDISASGTGYLEGSYNLMIRW
jgi:hypothetical protein